MQAAAHKAAVLDVQTPASTSNTMNGMTINSKINILHISPQCVFGAQTGANIYR